MDRAEPRSGDGRPPRLGQQVSDQPDTVAEYDTQFFRVGAFLLAASAVAALE